jgi:uncharacterized membrane protein
MSESSLAPWQRKLVLGAQRFIYWLSRHWLALVNLIVFLFVGVAFAAPVFMEMGWTQPAHAIYTVYKPLCHQLAFRSWFLFGEQAVYPRADYQVRFGMQDAGWPELFADARGFVGNDTMGYKVALCERDVAIYGAMLLGGLLYALLRRRGMRAMPFWLFLLVGVIPMGLDGGSQFVSLFVPGFPPRESVWQLRLLTGALFGLSLIWLAFPSIQEGMEESGELLAVRYGWGGYGPPPAKPTTRDQVLQLLEEKQLLHNPQAQPDELPRDSEG